LFAGKAFKKKGGKNLEDEEWLKDFYDISKRKNKKEDVFDKSMKPFNMKQTFFKGCGHVASYMEPLEGRASSYQTVYK
jgi:hypothetical protein